MEDVFNYSVLSLLARSVGNILLGKENVNVCVCLLFSPLLLSLDDHLTKLPVVQFIITTCVKLLECNGHLV